MEQQTEARQQYDRPSLGRPEQGIWLPPEMPASLLAQPLQAPRFSATIAEKVSESDSRSVISNSLQPHGLNSPWNSPGQNTGVGRLSLLQGIFPAQGLNRDLLHCRQILCQLSYRGTTSNTVSQISSGLKKFFFDAKGKNKPFL